MGDQLPHAGHLEYDPGRTGLSGYDVDLDRDGAPDLSFPNPDFNFKELRSNLVLRWEYGPGSTLFAVWNQGRSGTTGDGAFDLMRDAGRLFDLPGIHAFMLKLNYWLGL